MFANPFGVKAVYRRGGILIQNPFRNRFVLQVATLAGGTATAQGISLLCAPVLTRLYLPEQMGALAAVSAVVAVIGVVAAGQYDQAVVLPDNDRDAVSVAVAGFLLSTGIALLLLAVAGIRGRSVAPLIGLSRDQWYWVFLVPVLVYMLSAEVLLIRLHVRLGRFRPLAWTQIMQQMGASAGKIGLGFAGFGVGGLFLGHLTGHVIRFGRLLCSAWPFIRRHRDACRWAALWAQACRYRKFPLISSGSGVLHVISAQLPILLLAPLFSPAVVGYYALSYTLLTVPVSLIGQNTSHVFLERAARLRADREKLARIAISVYQRLLLVGAVPLSFITFHGDRLFPFVFGAGWAESGTYAQWLSVWLIFVFAATPLNNLYSILERQGEGFAWNAGLLVIRAAVIFSGHAFFGEALPVVALYSVVGAVSVLIWSIRMLVVAGGRIGSIVRSTIIILIPVMLVQYVIYELIRNVLG